MILFYLLSFPPGDAIMMSVLLLDRWCILCYDTMTAPDEDMPRRCLMQGPLVDALFLMDGT